MKYEQAFLKKVEELSTRLRPVRRCAIRTPSRLSWVVDQLTGRHANIPSGYVFLPHRPVQGDNSLDRVARTYCLLEEVESWLNRVDAGLDRHDAEMARQSAHKIARLKMAAEFGKADSDKSEADTPF